MKTDTGTVLAAFIFHNGQGQRAGGLPQSVAHGLSQGWSTGAHLPRFAPVSSPGHGAEWHFPNRCHEYQRSQDG